MDDPNHSPQGHRTPHRSAEFLHQSVAEAIRRRVAAGSLAGGSKLPPLRQIAEEFDVSTMTVRQALRLLEQEGQVYRIAGVGAFVRPPQSDRAGAGRMLAFSATDLRSPFEMGIARGVERACLQRGWAIQILDAGHDVELEMRNIGRLADSGSQGAIVLPTWGDPRCVMSLFALQSTGFPIVVADRIPFGLKADFVESDHEGGAFQATSCLLRRGHDRVFMLTPPPQVSSLAARIQGYQRAFRTRGMEPDPGRMIWLDLGVQERAFLQERPWFGSYEAVLPVLRESRRPLAVLAVDPYLAWGVYEAARELGLRIPEDVAVVGFDDSEIALAMQPAMTVVAQRTDEIGRIAVELLDRRIRAGPARDPHRRDYHHVIVDTELIERESTHRPDASDR